MFKNLSIRKKIFAGFGIILLLLAVVSTIGILSVNKISRNSQFVKDTAFRQALILIELEGLLTQMMNHVSTAVDSGTNKDLQQAEALKEQLDKKWADVETVFVQNEAILDKFLELKEKVDVNFRFGQDLVRLTINQEWTEIGPATNRFTASRSGLFKMVADMKQEGIEDLDRSLLENVRLTKSTMTLTGIDDHSGLGRHRTYSLHRLPHCRPHQETDGRHLVAGKRGPHKRGADRQR